MWMSGSITPPLPSPPITAPRSTITLATWISPTGVLITSQPYLAPSSSMTRDVLRFLQMGPRLPQRPTTSSTAIASVYSSPSGSPLSSISTQRSTSGSTAIPRSAFSRFTSAHRSPRLPGTGSGVWANRPLSSKFRPITVQPNRSKSCFMIRPPAPFTVSKHTRNRRSLTVSTCTYSSARISSMCSCAASEHSSQLPRRW
mmetsp:Transcript_44502/g.112132  ORF Transcript_44502/g.112132 Transcript_44502/m.112132 type:complete len:200 (+) Transcript_44502:428-1027(+)